ncbi:MAG TPA: heavy metal translocating P-type ATPase, partial [Pirellulales bacterium]|nr:heavy metal translocating P-type ATPase [Pirellulales bacterium]
MGNKYTWIVVLALVAIAAYVTLRFAMGLDARWVSLPLWIALGAGGVLLLLDVAAKVWQLDFGADLLALGSVVSAAALGQYLAGTLVVLMYAGGAALEGFAVRQATSGLQALARRMPSSAHRRRAGRIEEVSIDALRPDDVVEVYPGEACPVDGTVVEGNGWMDEAYLTGEPFRISKAPGASVFSGAINGPSALSVRATRLAEDSRYARIMRVMHESEQHRPHLRRLGDQLAAWYTPLVIVWAAVAWWFSGDPERFLAVLVVATPCPLLIGIPVAILGAISAAARRSIIIKNPASLEQLGKCRTIIFDKTGTLTYGEPVLTEQQCQPGFEPQHVLTLAATLERYSKHPLARTILGAADAAGIVLHDALEVCEPAGAGLSGKVDGHRVVITGRKQLASVTSGDADSMQLPAEASGLECVVVVDGQTAALYRFRDEPRSEGASFIGHLRPKHKFQRSLLVSGDREAEVRELAERVGITETYGRQSPEEKVAIVRRETKRARTVFVGDGINDAPAIAAATVGIAFGRSNEVTTAAADAIVLDTSLARVDELLHIA